MKSGGLLGCLALIIIALAVVAAKLCCFTVNEKEQVIVTRFQKAVGEPITKAGLQFKMPFVDVPNRISKQIQGWDGAVTEMPTKNKTYISVDTYARWKIVDVMLYFQRLNNPIEAESRLNDILGSETRNIIAKHNLIEVIRSTKDRVPVVSEELKKGNQDSNFGVLQSISKGRNALEKEIFETSKAKLKEFGIELLDIRFKRINYNPSVRQQIYERMKSERQQIAERFRSEGAGEAAKIDGRREKELAKIESGAYKEAEILKGKADARAAEIYADAFGSSPQAEEFYEFLRTMEIYEKMLSGESTVVLSTDSDIFKYLKSMNPKPAPATAVEGE